MEWKSDNSLACKNKALKEWHDWFAYYPVDIEVYNDLTTRKAWLVTVKRKGDYVNSDIGWNWEYRKI